jgi:ribonuclease E
MLYGEPDLTIRVIRDVFNEDFSKLVVSGEDAWDVVDEYVRYVAPHLADRVTRWQGDRDAFAEYRIDEQLAKALERKVWLPSGGSLVIDKTEAMTVVDVNTGKFTGQGGNLEETVTRNNLEAAEEIVRQLRLRDVGGIVVIDFIDMVLESNRELVLRRLLECLSRDRTKHQVAEVTSLGLVQMTRKRVGAGLLEAFSTPCECCNGRGVILTFDPDSDGHATQHTHSRGNGGHGNSGHGNGGHGNGGRGPSPAMVAARARSAEGSAPAEPSASAPADTPPADAADAPAPGPASGSASALVPASADSADPNAAQVANGQVPDTEREPARSSGRRRRRKPSAAAAPATPADTSASRADAPASQGDTTQAPTTPTTPTTPDTSAATSAAPGSPGTPAASDSSPVPVTSGAPEPPRPEASAEMPPAQGGVQGGAE